MKNFLILILLFIFMNKAFAVTELEARRFCEKWFPALVLGNQDTDYAVNRLLENFYTLDSILIDPNYNSPQIGHDSLRSYYSAVLSKYPNWKFVIENIYPTEGGFILHYSGSIPNKISFFRGVDIIELVQADGEYKIKKLTGVYDRTPFIELERIGDR